MKKRLLTGIIVVLMLVQSTLAFAKTDGERLQDYNLISGDATGDLKENDNLNRAELATILCKLNMVMDEAVSFNEDMGYIDIPATEWYYGYVNYAIHEGWLQGVSSNKFDPDGIVSEEMITTVLLRLLDYEPVWGESVLQAKGIGLYGYPNNPESILRGEVFSYVYWVLGLKVNNTEITLAEKIGIETPTYVDGYIVETYDYELEDYTYTDIYGNEVEYSYWDDYDNEDDYEETVYETIEEIGGYYYYMLSDGTILDRTAYEYEDWYYHEGEDYAYNTVLYNDEKYLILDYNYQVVTQGELPDVTQGKDFESSVYRFMEDYIWYFVECPFDQDRTDEQDEVGIMTELLVDYEGNVILGQQDEETEENDTWIFYLMDDGYILVEYNIYNEDLEVESTYNGLYDMASREYIKPLGEEFSYTFISDTEVIFIYRDYTEWVNLETGTSTTKKQSKLIDFIEWYEGDEYGLAYYLYSEDEYYKIYTGNVMDKDMNIILETDYDYYDIALSYDKYVVYAEEGLYGVMDFTGEVLIPPTYYHIYQDYDSPSLVAVVDESYEELVYFDLENDLMQIEEEDLYELQSEVFAILPNGNRIISSSDLMEYVDAEGNRIIEEDLQFVAVIGELECLYGYNMDYEVVLYSFEGEVIRTFEEYEEFYYLGGGVFEYNDGEKRFLGDIDGNILYGPYDYDSYILDGDY